MFGSAELGVVVIDSKAGDRGCKSEILCQELVEMLGGNRDFMQGLVEMSCGNILSGST